MNIRKNIDYSELYTKIDQSIVANLSQTELYLTLGRLVSNRPERGAAVMAPPTILIRLAFLLTICAECGIFSGCIKDAPKCLNRP